MSDVPFYKRAEFWAAIIGPLALAVWPLVVAKLPWLSALTAEQVTALLVGGIVAIITGALGVTAGAHARMRVK